MKILIVLSQFILTLLLVFVFPVYFAISADIQPNATKLENVEIYKFKFIPKEITVKSGATIRWTNKEKRQYHSVWFEKQGEPEPEYFFPDEFYDRTFTKTGSFPYRCGPHPRMTGTVHVE